MITCVLCDFRTMKPVDIWMSDDLTIEVCSTCKETCSRFVEISMKVGAMVKV